MKFKRWYTKLVYQIDTLSPAKLILSIIGFIILPTVLVFSVVDPQKFRQFTSAMRSTKKLSPIGLYYQSARVNPILEDLNSNFDPRVIIYNRVPKCASIYTTRLLYQLGRKDKNNFKVMSPYEPGEHPWLEEREIRDHMQWMDKELETLGSSLVYIRHQYFIDFENWERRKQPIYINIIRDPIDRFTSFYYFVRNGNQEGDGGEVKMPEMKKRMSLDECVQMRDRECMQPKWQLIPYFCGQEPMCRHRASWALQKAKQNIEKYFAVVGIVEDLDTTFSVMERMLPGFFKGAVAVNAESDKLSPSDTKTIGKIPPSKETKTILKTKTSLAMEYELYYFVKDRLYQMNEQLKR